MSKLQYHSPPPESFSKFDKKLLPIQENITQITFYAKMLIP
jgi:hypothetical protein